jgi:hypothetical protein
MAHLVRADNLREALNAICRLIILSRDFNSMHFQCLGHQRKRLSLYEMVVFNQAKMAILM